jgi:hypothetical protein
MRKRRGWMVLTGLIMGLAGAALPGRAQSARGAVMNLLPRIAGWEKSEEPKSFGPESLFEYIDGAAEAFISYDFIELALGQYRKPGAAGTMTVEIYDMGTPGHAFGIYSTERYPDTKFLPIGTQGYIEEGTLNFFAGRYYVKMMAFETGPQTDALLKSYASEILKKIGDPGDFPAAVKMFPRQGLVANSEKSILKNFLGLEFLRNGIIASYKLGETQPDAFIIESPAEAEAALLLKKYLDTAAAKGIVAEKKGGLHKLQDPYLAGVFIGQTGRFLFGVTKIKDPAAAEGEKLALALGAALGVK